MRASIHPRMPVSLISKSGGTMKTSDRVRRGRCSGGGRPIRPLRGSECLVSTQHASSGERHSSDVMVIGCSLPTCPAAMIVVVLRPSTVDAFDHLVLERRVRIMTRRMRAGIAPGLGTGGVRIIPPRPPRRRARAAGAARDGGLFLARSSPSSLILSSVAPTGVIVDIFSASAFSSSCLRRSSTTPPFRPCRRNGAGGADRRPPRDLGSRDRASYEKPATESTIEIDVRRTFRETVGDRANVSGPLPRRVSTLRRRGKTRPVVFWLMRLPFGERLRRFDDRSSAE
jgi:hypothetical protein